jgi:uncharacterized membrane protein YozB (DUF420 family)
MILLLVIGAGIVVWGFLTGFESNDGLASSVLLNYAYITVALALLAIIIGFIVGARGDAKSFIRLGIGILAIAAFVFIVYLIAPGKEAIGLVSVEQPSKGMLKLTDTILYMAYILVAVAVVAIIVGEIRMSLTNKKG